MPVPDEFVLAYDYGRCEICERGNIPDPNFVHMECKLRLGYTNKYMTAYIPKIEVVDGKNTDLHIDKPVYAIHLADVREL